MRIIQSFAQYKEGSPYTKNKNICLNFYSFLLSYLELNKYYGHVTMICNKEAYETFIKYIPYDDVIFLENKNDFLYWSVYKLDAMKLIDGDLIHVDSDVIIFDDHFRSFIDGGSDILVQDITSDNQTGIDYVRENSEFLKENNIIDARKYDGRFTSCGVLGIKNTVKENYYKAADETYQAMKNDIIKGIIKRWYPMIIEELTLYLVAFTNKYTIQNILPTNLIEKMGTQAVGNEVKYSHLWFDSRLDSRTIDLVRRKIRNEFPYYRKLIDKFETEVKICM